MAIFGVIFAIAAVVVLVTATKEIKKAKNAENARQESERKEATNRAAAPKPSQPSQPTSSLMQPSRTEQQRITPISSTLNVEDKDEARARAKRELEARLSEYKARKAELEARQARANGGVATSTISPRVAVTTTAHSHNEAHSDVVYKDHAKYRVEEVPVMNSIGGQSDEGCSEHYNLRYVKLDKPIIPEHLELTELQKCIVYGEIINQPAFRKNYRR